MPRKAPAKSQSIASNKKSSTVEADSKTRLKTKWRKLQRKLEQHFAALTDDDLVFAERTIDELLPYLQQTLGLPREDLRQELHRFGPDILNFVAQITDSTTTDLFARDNFPNFFYSICHDLHNRLEIIIGTMGLHLLEPRGIVPDDTIKDMERVIRIAQYLMFSIDNAALAVRHRLRGTLIASRDKVLLKDVIEVIFLDISSSIERDLLHRKLPRSPLFSFHNLDAVPAIYGNRYLLHQAFVNLLSNAIKACLSDLRIEVVAVGSDDGWTIKFRDWGTGLTPEQVTYLSQEKYFSLREFLSAHKVPATEAARYITKRTDKDAWISWYVTIAIVNQHGGHISVSHYVDPTEISIFFPTALQRMP
jgi:signal transduction histidine kinase